MTPRWVIERLHANGDDEYLQVVQVYTEGENKETVKRENRDWAHRRLLLHVSDSYPSEIVREGRVNAVL